ncbi:MULTISPECIES: type II toxin-antitoxin system PemK/MazF family toxin [Corynebacterium]|uniref:type II toxin-antitoxin system PemK/MazF family toxin n=1 Tax=Corynebacterium TaxID=1716 RepID=UPI00124D2F02|nr:MULTISPECIES: type II toxin-antitoxin system PemK/MazF family toxin [Corynebacterium]MBV7301441.1 type II toxin-antitoxin system PemK/MazF family toxin [Corynebacterium sp. TAE3-ERU2]
MGDRLGAIASSLRDSVCYVAEQFQPPSDEDLDDTLATVRERLGISGTETNEDLRRLRAATSVLVHDSRVLSRNIYYAADMDGQAEPGEVVWVWLRTEPTSEPEDRALVVVGRTRQTILGLLISSNPEHQNDPSWLDIGSGNWDLAGEQSWVRIDRVIEASELGIRRQGAILPRRRFGKIAHRLRSEFGWS